MRVEFARDGLVEPLEVAGRHVLGVFLTLEGTDGPLHARGLGHAVAALETGTPAEQFQINTPSFLRDRLASEVGDPRFAASDPRELPIELCSERWRLLCEEIDRWTSLGKDRRRTLAILLNKLGAWTALARIPAPLVEVHEVRDPDDATLHLIQANVLVKTGAPGAMDGAARVLAGLAQNTRLPAATRAAVGANLVVHLARTRARVERVTEWCELTQQLAPADEPALGRSVRLRACSFGPFVRGDVAGTRAVLDDAEAAGDAAVHDGACSALAAQENRHPLLETRAREAEWAGDSALAGDRLRALAELDPLDAKVHVRLGDHLLRAGRPEPAQGAYLRAAALGAPYTSYALTQAGRCAELVEDTALALALFAAAGRSDPRAVTPLQQAVTHSGRAPAAVAGARLLAMGLRLPDPQQPIADSGTGTSRTVQR